MRSLYCFCFSKVEDTYWFTSEEEDFNSKMKSLTKELEECFKESRKLEKSIKDNLEEIGYAIK